MRHSQSIQYGLLDHHSYLCVCVRHESIHIFPTSAACCASRNDLCPAKETCRGYKRGNASCLLVHPSTTHRSTPQYTATHCSTLQHTATHCNTLQHTAAHCNIPQHAAADYSTLQRTATRCNTRHYLEISNSPDVYNDHHVQHAATLRTTLSSPTILASATCASARCSNILMRACALTACA